MNSVIITVAISTIFFFAQQSIVEESEADVLITQQTSKIIQNQPTLELNNLPVKEESKAASETISTLSEESLGILDQEAPQPSIRAIPEHETQEFEPLSSLPSLEEYASVGISKQYSLPEKKETESILEHFKSPPVLQSFSSGESFGPFGECPELTGSASRRLKRELLRNLSKDKLISSKKEEVKIEILSQGIRVNDEIINRKLSQKYERIMRKYEITAGPERQIRISPEYIMVGDFTTEGFRGSMSGSIDLDELKDLPGNKPYGFAAVSSEPFGLFEGEGGAGNNEGKVLFGATSGRGNSQSFGLFHGDLGFEGDEGNGIFEGEGDGNCGGSVGLNSREVRRLKKELLSLLEEEQYVSGDNPKAKIDLHPDGIIINNDRMADRLFADYENIIKKYGISYCEGRYILLSPGVIMILDFGSDGKFIGGTVNSDEKTDFNLFDVDPDEWVEY